MSVMTTEQNSDARLVAAAARGDQEAFGALFRTHYRRVYNFALRLTSDGDSSEDITQTAFVRAYESISRLRDGQAFLKFMFRIVVNLVRDRAKSARRKPWVSFDDMTVAGAGAEPVEFADESLDPHRITAGAEMHQALLEQLAALAPEFREVVVLHHMEEMDVREISRTLGVPEGTVKSRLGRARAKLREALAGWMDQG
jgi:RNA polymerase sigma-70 factor (ECF subfamily)